MTDHRSIIGTYDTHETANFIVDELKQHGFSARKIEVMDRGADGAVKDRLMSWGLPDADAQSYAAEVDNGRTLVVLDAKDDQVNEAVQIMRNERGMGTAPEGTILDGEEATARVPVVEEELHVGKERVTTGGVRVVHRTTEQPVSQDVELREEEIHVERHAADRPVTAEDEAALARGEIELTESEERAVVAKEARVVEEVEVGKTERQRTERIEDTVRREDVDIEHIEGLEGKDRPEAHP